MKTKIIPCVGYRSATSGGFDWFQKREDAAEGFAEAVRDYGSLKNDPHDIAEFVVKVPASLTGEAVTEYIDRDLDAHIDASLLRGGSAICSLSVADKSDQ